MKTIENYKEHLKKDQGVDEAHIQKDLAALGWDEYYVRSIKQKKDGTGATVEAINKNDGELVFIKKMPLTHVKVLEDGDTDSREKQTHRTVHQKPCRNIAEKRNIGSHGNFLFYATEFVEHDFSELIEKRAAKEISLDDVTGAFMGYCDGLRHIHEMAMLVHRDITPNNLRFDINENGEIVPKIIDFGLACGLDASLTITGTVGYMAPESKRKDSKEVSPDIFSLGICLYEATSRPGEKKVYEQQLELIRTDKKLQEEHERINKDEKLERAAEKDEAKSKANIRRFHEIAKPLDEAKYLFEIFRKATQPEPGDRYQRAAEMKQDLRIAQERMQLDQIINAFDAASKVSEKIKDSVPFDLTLAEDASQAKLKLYEEFREEGINLQSSAVIPFVEAQIKEKLKPVKDAASAYLRPFKFTADNLPVNGDMAAAYRVLIDKRLAGMDDTVRRNLFEMTSRLKKFYQLCGLPNNPLFDMLLESRSMKREALQNKVQVSYSELLKKTEAIGTATVILEDSDFNDPAVIAGRLNAYCAGLKSREPNAKDLRDCIEIKNLLEGQQAQILAGGNKLSSSLTGILEQIDAYVKRAQGETQLQVFFNMGLDAYHAGKMSAAIEYFQQAGKHSPKPNPNIEYNIGNARQALGENVEAKRQYRLATDIRKAASARESISILNNSSVLFANGGMPQQARALLEIAEGEAPNDPEVQFNLAMVCRELNDPETAVRHFERAFSLKQSDDVHNFLAQEYFKAGDFAKAREHAQKYANGLKGRIPNPAG